MKYYIQGILFSTVITTLVLVFFVYLDHWAIESSKKRIIELEKHSLAQEEEIHDVLVMQKDMLNIISRLQDGMIKLAE